MRFPHHPTEAPHAIDTPPHQTEVPAALDTTPRSPGRRGALLLGTRSPGRRTALLLGTLGTLGTLLAAGAALRATQPGARPLGSDPLPLLPTPQPFPVVQLRHPGGALVEGPTTPGRAGLVAFFASWCAPCRRELPVLEALTRAWATPEPDAAPTLTLVAFLEAPSVATSFTRELGLTTVPLIDESGAASRRLGVAGLPATLLVDAHSRIRARWLGELPEVALRQRLPALLAAL